jgi:hypothetical protein
MQRGLYAADCKAMRLHRYLNYTAVVQQVLRRALS